MLSKTKPDNEDNNKSFTKKEFDNVLKILKDEKAEGSDSISNEMIKNSPKVNSTYYLNLLTFVLKHHLFLTLGVRI